jgi:3-oxoacyl-[acyl-carrier-protein] synthase-3
MSKTDKSSPILENGSTKTGMHPENKPFSLTSPVGISSLGAYLPSRVLTNFDLEKMVDTSDEWITTRTGISQRRIAAPDEATSDLAIRAAQQALERASWPADRLDLIIVATVTPDMFFPSTASLVQGTIGAKQAGAFDLQIGCTGFIYGLVMGASAIAAGAFESILVIGAECLSRITDWNDRSTCVLFGDGAAAALLRPTASGRGLLSFVLGNDAGGADKLRINAGGSRMPATEETVHAREHFLKMEGNEVFKFAVRIMEEAALQVLERAGLGISDLSLLIPHQANVRIMDAAARRLGLPPEKVFSNVDRYGNTSAASIPIALDEAVQSGRLKEGDTVVCVSFGAGLSWAAAALRW